MTLNKECVKVYSFFDIFFFVCQIRSVFREDKFVPGELR